MQGANRSLIISKGASVAVMTTMIASSNRQDHQDCQEQVERPNDGPTPADATKHGAPLPLHTILPQKDFLAAYRDALVTEVARSAPPLYRGTATVPTVRLSLLKRKPLGAQALAIRAAACGLRGQRATPTDPGWRRSAGLGLVFEMGTGKTYCSLATLAMADEEVTRVTAPADQQAEKRSFFPAVVLCPPIMQEKWAREAEQTLPGTARVVILRPLMTRAEAAEFRRFDPTFRGTKLSAIGVADRIAARIRSELATWQGACRRAQAVGKRPPAKPCHLVVVSTSTAKFGMPWTPVYVMRVLRAFDEVSGSIRAQRDPETGALITVPCCPHCYAPVAEDERHAAARARAKKNQRAQQVPPSEQPGKALHENATSGSISAEGARTAGDNTLSPTPYPTATNLPDPPVSTDRASTSLGLDIIEGDDEELDALVRDLPYLSEDDLLGVTGPRVKRRCASCGEALWQTLPDGAIWRATPPPLAGDLRMVTRLPIPDRHTPHRGLISTANRRYPIADFLRRRHRGLFRALIADEAHQLKGAGTAQGFAAASLVDACEPQGSVLFLTGTLFSGCARRY